MAEGEGGGGGGGRRGDGGEGGEGGRGEGKAGWVMICGRLWIPSAMQDRTTICHATVMRLAPPPVSPLIP